jgi:hypothetical protein
MAYATADDLADLLGNQVPPNAQRLLDRASRDVDRAIKCARYSTDVNDLPTDPVVLAALKAATLEQVAWRLECGDVNGIRHDAQSGVPSGGGAGSVSLSRTGNTVGAATGGTPQLGDQPQWILRQAGLMGLAPITYLGG